MTSTPLNPESRRMPAYAAVALVLVMAAVLLAAGCVEPAAQENQVITISVTPTVVLSGKELAEQTITDAEEQIEKTDAVIGWFRGNATTRDDKQLTTIMTKREIAMSYIVRAKDEISSGNYAQAQIKAQEANAKANESYTDVLNRQNEINSVAHCGGQQTGSAIVIMLISVILTSIFPAILAAYTYSLFKTIHIPAVEQFRQCTSNLSDLHVFVGTWIIYSAVLSIAVVTKQLFNPYLFLFGTKITFTAFWSGLVILTMIMSVLVLGLVIRSIILTYQRPGHHEFGAEEDAPVRSGLNRTVVGEILVVIVLLFLMFFVIRFAFVIRGPFVLCA